MSFYINDNLYAGKAGDQVAAAYRTGDDELPPPLGWHLILDLGGCDSALITDREHVAAWGERLHDRFKLAGIGPTVAFDVFGPVQDPGIVARFVFRQPGWRGNAQPFQADAVVRCDPPNHGVHIDFLTAERPGSQAIAALSVDHFAARCGDGHCRARRVPGLTTGLRLNWQEDDL
jgi:hypothetical protein